MQPVSKGGTVAGDGDANETGEMQDEPTTIDAKVRASAELLRKMIASGKSVPSKARFK